MIKNVAGQNIGAQLISRITGEAFSGSVSVLVTGNGGTQTAGGGVVTSEGNGYFGYVPTQAETNYDHVAFTFIGTNALPFTAQVYPQTIDAALQAVLDAISTLSTSVDTQFDEVLAAIESGIPIELDEDQLQELADAINTNIPLILKTGGGTMSARVSISSVAPNKFLEIIQGEERVITFLVESETGSFFEASPDFISVKIQDPKGNVVFKEEILEDPETSESEATDSPITRVTEELDVQVFRLRLDPEDTLQLTGGLARIEIAIGNQKARLTHAIKMVEQIPEPEVSS